MKNLIKKATLLVAAFMLTLNIWAQTFNGIKVGLPFVETDIQLKEKGFTLKESSGNLITYVGKIGNLESAEVVLVVTPKTKIVWKIIAEASRNYTWYGVKSDYERFKSIIQSKYGEPKSDYSFFSSPYKEGDGYEMSAIRLEKCTYASFFRDSLDNSIIVDIESFEVGKAVVSISYQNRIASDIYKKEKSDIENKTF